MDFDAGPFSAVYVIQYSFIRFDRQCLSNAFEFHFFGRRNLRTEKQEQRSYLGSISDLVISYLINSSSTINTRQASGKRKGPVPVGSKRPFGKLKSELFEARNDIMSLIISVIEFIPWIMSTVLYGVQHKPSNILNAQLELKITNHKSQHL